MNVNIILAILEVKGILNHDESLRIAEHVAEKPQSTYYADAISAANDLLDAPAPPILPQLGPVGPEQHAEEVAARMQAAAPLASSNEPVGPNDAYDSESKVSEPTAEPEDKPKKATDAGAVKAGETHSVPKAAEKPTKPATKK